MKTIKTLLSVFAIAAVFSTGALAQTNGSITADAEVVAAMSIDGTTTGNALDFGNIISGQTKTIDFQDADAGTFYVSGAQNSASINLSVTFPTELTEVGVGTATMSTGTYTAGYLLGGTDNPAGATSLGAPSGQNIAGDITTGGSDTEFYVYVGMDVTAGGSQTAGSYTDNITLTLTYN